MVRFYLVTNTNRLEPAGLRAYSYVHVKGKTCGSQTAILSEEEIVCEGVEELTQGELQQIIDEWIAWENEPEQVQLDIDGNPLLQSPINLEVFLAT